MRTHIDQFPARANKYWLEWANGEATGSKQRRGHGYCLDAILRRDHKEIRFVEVKPPGSSHTMKELLHDYWNLANLAKDAIDSFLRTTSSHKGCVSVSDCH